MPENGYKSIRCCALKVLMLANAICGDTVMNWLIRLINPFIPNRISRLYQLKESILNFRGVRWLFSFFFQILSEHSVSKQ